MPQKILLLDIDEVFCFPGFLNAINEFLNTNYKIDDFTEYYMDEVAIPKERFDEFNKFLNNKNLYENAYILPYAKKVLKELSKYYDIYPCSSCVNPFNIAGSGKLFANKYNFLITTIPFIKPEKYIFTSSKHLFKGDIQIDDRLSNLDENIETKILFPSYHNKNITNEELIKNQVIRAGYEWRTGWLEVANILLEPSQIEDDELKHTLKLLK